MKGPVLRLLRLTMVVLGLVVLSASVPDALADDEVATEGRPTRITVKARLTGWVAHRDGFHLYRPGTTVGMPVNVWPAPGREQVRARLEWRRAGSRWRLVQVSRTELSRDGRALFLVRNLPAGYAFRIRARVPAGEDHRAGRSRWRYFRAR